jgi:hypothetical protein
MSCRSLTCATRTKMRLNPFDAKSIENILWLIGTSLLGRRPMAVALNELISMGTPSSLLSTQGPSLCMGMRVTMRVTIRVMLRTPHKETRLLTWLMRALSENSDWSESERDRLTDKQVKQQRQRAGRASEGSGGCEGESNSDMFISFCCLRSDRRAILFLCRHRPHSEHCSGWNWESEEGR